MISFCGEISDTCKQYLLKINAITVFICSLIPATFLGGGALLVYIFSSMFELWMLILCEIFLLLFVILATISPYLYQTKTLQNIVPKSIEFEDSRIIEVEFKTSRMVKSFDDIKKIVDFGEWYYIVFKFPKKSNIVCQKNLMVNGDTKDFESLVGDKIIENKKGLDQ